MLYGAPSRWRVHQSVLHSYIAEPQNWPSWKPLAASEDPPYGVDVSNVAGG
jgi:hypothetical protein